MFKSLRTSTKLLLLCSVFVGALAVATYSLVAEKQIAIHFVRKELVGVEHLVALRQIYAALLTEKPGASITCPYRMAGPSRRCCAPISPHLPLRSMCFTRIWRCFQILI
jgi:hypothetical protein